MTPEGDAHKQQTFLFNGDAELKQPIFLDEESEQQAGSKPGSYAEQHAEGLEESWQEVLTDSDTLEAELTQEVMIPAVTVAGKRSLWRVWMKVLALLASILVIAESVSAFNQYWLESPVMAGIFAAFISLLLIGVFSIVFAEWRKLTALQQVAQRRATSEQIFSGEPADAIESYCNSLLSSRMQEQMAESIEQWRTAQEIHHSDADRLALYESIVLKRCDQAALAVVAKWSAEAGVLVGASPLAALDLLFIVWRNTRMLNAVAECYGVELGFFSRLKLLHMVLFNLAFVGATEVSIDIGLQGVGADMLTKLSGRIAQGMGAGLLSARLGLKAMQLCRPVSFNEKSNPPSFRDVSRELRNTLVERLRVK